MPKSPNHSSQFWGQNRETWATSFEAKPEKTVVTSFEAKPEKTVPVVLRPNQWQTFDLGFQAQPKNLRSSSFRARCRPHTSSSDLPIVWPLSIQPVRPSPVLCTRSPTPATILITTRHATPSIYTPWDKQTWFSTWTKYSRIEPRKCSGFEFKSCQVNDPSQSNQGTDHLVSQSLPSWVHWQRKAQSLKFKFKTPWSTARRSKSQEKLNNII
jgi:hypothetical protein